MHRSLRPFLRSRWLLGLSLLAWLALAIGSPMLWAHGGGGPQRVSTAPPSSLMPSTQHIHGTAACCDPSSAQPHHPVAAACACSVLCASALPAAVAAVPDAARWAASYPALPRVGTPRWRAVPPLRPPQA